MVQKTIPGQASVTRSTHILHSLYREQLRRMPTDTYLAGHAADRVARTQAAVFEWYSPYLPAQGRVLEWGCRHAPDACLMRARFGQALRMDACDFAAPGTYAVFHDYAGVHYRALNDVVRLPYENASFDAVLGSGTLEHVAMDYESLKELYRVLKPGGKLIISYLPNRYSLEEWYWRAIRGELYHRRLYGLGEVRRLLLHTGFNPLVSGFQSRLDLLPDRGWKHRLLRALAWVAPLHRFCSTLCVIAAKVEAH